MTDSAYDFIPSNDWAKEITILFYKRNVYYKTEGSRKYKKKEVHSFTYFCNRADEENIPKLGKGELTELQEKHYRKRKEQMLEILSKKNYTSYMYLTPSLHCIPFFVEKDKEIAAARSVAIGMVPSRLKQNALGVDYNVLRDAFLLPRKYDKNTAEYQLFRRPCLYFLSHSADLNGSRLIKTGSASAGRIHKRLKEHANDFKALDYKQTAELEDSPCFGITIHSLYRSTEKRTGKLVPVSGSSPDPALKEKLESLIPIYDKEKRRWNHFDEEQEYKEFRKALAAYDPEIIVDGRGNKFDFTDGQKRLEQFFKDKDYEGSATTKFKPEQLHVAEATFNEQVVEESLKSVFLVNERYGENKSDAEWYVINENAYINAFNTGGVCYIDDRKKPKPATGWTRSTGSKEKNNEEKIGPQFGNKRSRSQMGS